MQRVSSVPARFETKKMWLNFEDYLVPYPLFIHYPTYTVLCNHRDFERSVMIAKKYEAKLATQSVGNEIMAVKNNYTGTAFHKSREGEKLSTQRYSVASHNISKLQQILTILKVEAPTNKNLACFQFLKQKISSWRSMADTISAMWRIIPIQHQHGLKFGGKELLEAEKRCSDREGISYKGHLVYWEMHLHIRNLCLL